MAGTLKDKVKRKLDITWSDEDTDARVDDIIDTAIPTMRHKLGLPEGYAFEEAGPELNLLLAWCLYEWNHAADEFDANYLGDIIQVRNKWAVKGATSDAQG